MNDAEKATPPTPPRRVRLRTARDIHRFLARVTNELYQDAPSMTATKAGRLAYLASTILNAIETAELEERVEVLEKAQARADAEAQR